MREEINRLDKIASFSWVCFTGFVVLACIIMGGEPTEVEPVMSEGINTIAEVIY